MDAGGELLIALVLLIIGISMIGFGIMKGREKSNREEHWHRSREESEQSQHQQTDAKRSTSGMGIFVAVLLAILAAVWLIPRLFEFTVTITPIK